MNRTTIGVLTGLAMVSVAALPSLAANSGSSSGHGSDAAGNPASARAAAAAVTSKAASTKPVTSTKAAPVVVKKAVRTVKLTLPTSGKVGSTVSGSIQVVDTNGQVSAPVPGVAVALQQKRGSTWATVADGTTSEGGSFAVSITLKATTTTRAVYTPASGAPVSSASITTTVLAQVTWGARPDMDVVHGVATKYSFRVSPAAGTGHLEIANASSPTKWIKANNLAVPSTGLVTESVIFPSAGNWLVRGVSAAAAGAAAGSTSVLPISVS